MCAPPNSGGDFLLETWPVSTHSGTQRVLYSQRVVCGPFPSSAVGWPRPCSPRSPSGPRACSDPPHRSHGTHQHRFHVSPFFEFETGLPIRIRIHQRTSSPRALPARRGPGVGPAAAGRGPRCPVGDVPPRRVPRPLPARAVAPSPPPEWEPSRNSVQSIPSSTGNQTNEHTHARVWSWTPESEGQARHESEAPQSLL